MLRFNWVGIQTQYWKNPGGLQTQRTDEKRNAMVQRVAANYSTLVRVITRKNGKLDLKFCVPMEYWKGYGTPGSDSAPPATAPAPPTPEAPPSE